MFSGLTFALLLFTGQLICGLMPTLHKINYCTSEGAAYIALLAISWDLGLLQKLQTSAGAKSGPCVCGHPM